MCARLSSVEGEIIERLHDACRIVGIYSGVATQNNEQIDVRSYLTLALTALQHRGQESAGMAVYTDEGQIASRIEMGKVREVFSDSGKGLPESEKTSRTLPISMNARFFRIRARACLRRAVASAMCATPLPALAASKDPA